MRKMIRRVLALFSAIVLLSSSADSSVFAAIGTEAAETEEAVVSAEASDASQNDVKRGFADVSDKVIQEGGSPKPAADEESDTVIDEPGDAVAAGNLEGAKKAIYEGLKNRKTSITVSSYRIQLQDVEDVYWSVINSHPELFYVKARFTYSYRTYIDSVEPQYRTEYPKTASDDFDRKTGEIISGIDNSWGDLEKALYLHEWIVTHCDYDDSLQKRDAYTVIIEGCSVCEGYSLAYEYLLQKAGIDGQVVISDEINHEWNMLSIDGKWYYTDCTWDDPSNIGGPFCEHDNFLRSRDGMVETEHTSDDWVGGEDAVNVYQSVPGGTDYDHCFWSEIQHPLPVLDSKTLAIKGTTGTIYDFSAAQGSEYTVSSGDWMVWGSNMHYRTGYPGAAAVGDLFYYSTPDSIYSMTADGSQERVYSLSASEAAKGYIYGILSEGNAITYYLKQEINGGVTYEGTYTVPATGNVSVTGVTLNKSDESIAVGETLQLTATVSPKNATNKNVSWKSGDTGIATVTQDGLVTGVKAGETRITVATEDGNKTAACIVTVTEEEKEEEENEDTIGVTGVEVRPYTAGMVVGDTLTLTAGVIPANATNKNVSWQSNDPSVASVDNTGTVTAEAAGDAVITAVTEDGGFTSSCSVTVTEKYVKVTGISIVDKGIKINAGEETTVSVVLLPDNATNKRLLWSSKNEGVATVSDEGVVKGIKEGTTTITVVSEDNPKVSASVSVTVKRGNVDPDPDPNPNPGPEPEPDPDPDHEGYFENETTLNNGGRLTVSFNYTPSVVYDGRRHMVGTNPTIPGKTAAKESSSVNPDIEISGFSLKLDGKELQGVTIKSFTYKNNILPSFDVEDHKLRKVMSILPKFSYDTKKNPALKDKALKSAIGGLFSNPIEVSIEPIPLDASTEVHTTAELKRDRSLGKKDGILVWNGGNLKMKYAIRKETEEEEDDNGRIKKVTHKYYIPTGVTIPGLYYQRVFTLPDGKTSVKKIRLRAGGWSIISRQIRFAEVSGSKFDYYINEPDVDGGEENKDDCYVEPVLNTEINYKKDRYSGEDTTTVKAAPGYFTGSLPQAFNGEE